jgi:hypothetical protein
LRRGEKQILQPFNALAALALQFLERTDDFETYKIMLEVSLMNEEMNKHPGSLLDERATIVEYGDMTA